MKKHTFINLTPHDIKLNSGEVYKATGNVARVITALLCQSLVLSSDGAI